LIAFFPIANLDRDSEGRMTFATEEYRQYKFHVSTAPAYNGYKGVFEITDPQGHRATILHGLEGPIFPTVTEALIHGVKAAKHAVDLMLGDR
jgi:hypothetical protein